MSLSNPLKNRKAYILLPFVLLALIARIYGLTSKGLWLDEAITAHYVQQSFHDLMQILRTDCHPPLYYLLLRIGSALFGSGEGALRGLSVLFSLGSVALLFSLLKRYVSLAAACIGAWLLVLSPLHIYYAQEARTYALLGFLGLCVIYSAIHYLNGKKTAALWIMGLTSLLMLLTHNVALWFIAGCFIAFLICAGGWRYRFRGMVMMAAVGLAYTPWLYVLLKQLSAPGTILKWFLPLWRGKSVFGHLMDSLNAFLFGPFPPYLAISYEIRGSWIILIAAAGLIAYGIFKYVKRMPLRFILLFFLFSLILNLGYSILISPTFIPGRSVYYYLPFFLLLMGIGITALRIRIIQIGLLVSYSAFALHVLIPYYGNPEKNDSKNYLQVLHQKLKPGDRVVTTGTTYFTCDYYFRRWETPAEIWTYPADIKKQFPRYEPRLDREQAKALIRDARMLSRDLYQTLSPQNKIGMISTPDRKNDILYETLSGRFKLAEILSPPDFRESVLKSRVTIYFFEKE